MKGKQIVAIDVGSTNVVMAVGAVLDDGRVDILGIATEPVQGINAGRVENSETVGRAVRTTKERLENKLGIKITEAYAGISGDYIRCVQVTDHVYVRDEVGNGCNQITERDIEALDRRMESVNLPDDREEIIVKTPLRYMVDDKEVDEPVGAYGNRLSAIYNFILSDSTMRERLRICLNKQDITVKEFVPNAMISHLSVATTDDMEDGAVVVNLGGGLTDVTVLQSGKVRYFASIPMGVATINGDIRSYGIPNSYVESLKVNYGSAVHDLTVDDKIVFPHARKGTPKSIRRRNLATIIENRLIDICDLVKREIKEAGCGSRFSPVVLITGGGAEMQNIEQLFARELKIEESRSVYPEYGFGDSLGEHITTRAYASIASLLLYGASRGMCSVAVIPQQPKPETPHFGGTERFVNHEVEEVVPQPRVVHSEHVVEQPKKRVEEPEVVPPTIGTVEPEPESETGDDVGFDIPEAPKKPTRISKIFDKFSDFFAGKDDEYNF